MNSRLQRGLIFIGIIIIPLLLGLLFTYEIIAIPFPTNMSDHPGSDNLTLPRELAPEGAVPVQGLPAVPGEFPSNPVSADSASLKRGEILYDIHCQLCHGEEGHGDGPLSIYFDHTPQNLTDTVITEEFDGSVYLTILDGFGEMPSLEENLTPGESWDVVNYVRTLPPQ